jgi:hypothetical protein
LEERQAELLPVLYFHVVFSLPGTIADIAYQTKAIIYRLLFKAAAEALIIIAADPKHLGARIGVTAVLHTWGSALTHHPHVHIIVPGGGISPDGERWIACRPNFFLPVRVLSRLFRRLFLEKLTAAHDAGQLRRRRARHLQVEGLSSQGRRSLQGHALDADEFIRRFLIHVLPEGFHRIRHYGLFANGNRADNIARARHLLDVPEPAPLLDEGDGAGCGEEDAEWKTCPCCGGRMVVIETFGRGCPPRTWPIPSIGIDSS